MFKPYLPSTAIQRKNSMILTTLSCLLPTSKGMWTEHFFFREAKCFFGVCFYFALIDYWIPTYLVALQDRSATYYARSKIMSFLQWATVHFFNCVIYIHILANLFARNKNCLKKKLINKVTVLASWLLISFLPAVWYWTIEQKGVKI